MKYQLQVVSDKHKRKFDVELLNKIREKFNPKDPLNPFFNPLRKWESLEIKVDDKLLEFFIKWMKDFINNKDMKGIIIYDYNNNNTIQNVKLVGCYPVSCECLENNEGLIEIGFNQVEM